MTLSLIFIFINHPLSLGCILLAQTILIALISGYFYLNFWYSYILFLIIIGGILVIFIYITRIASNEKFKLPKNILLFFLLGIAIIIATFLFIDPFFSNNITLSFNQINRSQEILINYSANKLFNYPNIQFIIFLIIYLLITLIAIVKIVGKNYGTLRQK